MSARLNKEHAQFNSRPRVVKTCLWSRIARKPSIPYDEIFTVDLLGWITFRAKILKTSVRQISSKKSVIQIFILLCMNVKSDRISYSWKFEVTAVLRKRTLVRINELVCCNNSFANIDCKLTYANSQEDNTFIHTRHNWMKCLSKEGHCAWMVH